MPALKRRLAALREHVRAGAANRPGIYRLLGPKGEVLYIGKSVHVRSRLLSYFRGPRGSREAELLDYAFAIDWSYVPNEFAAVLEELRQIRRWRPLYNVEHRRERQYCFLKLTREAAPRFLLVAHADDDGARYYGPFHGRRRVKEATRELADLLELRDCPATTPMRFADQRDLFGREYDPLCLRGELRRCLAPCAGRCTRGQYLGRVRVAQRFLEGDADAPLETLRMRMQEAAERLQFEYAAQLRDRAERLQQLRDELVVLRGTMEALSFGYLTPGFSGEDRLYLIRRGSVRAEFALPTADTREILARSRAVFAPIDPQGAAVHPHQVAEILLVARWFRLRSDERARTIPPERVLAGALTDLSASA